MAVLCPIYDPVYGWHIIDQSGKKKFFSSILYYYYSLGVSPPVGAEITQDDFEEFEIDLCSENNDYDDLGFLSTYSENFMPKISDLPPSVQFQPMYPDFASLSEDVNQIPSTSLTDPYAPMALPNYQVGPSLPFIGHQPLNQAYPNQLGLLNEAYNSYLSNLPLPLPTSKMSMSKEMETLDDQDEFEEDSFMYDSSSTKSSPYSEMSYNNII